MASSSSTSLTKFSSGSTIFTANLANSMYGGLYGSPEASSLAADDPRVAGHVHDGQHIDGHSQKINLVDHVTGQITSPNIADNSINYTKVANYISVDQAIPEYVNVGGIDYYYLDLSNLRDELAPSLVFEKKNPSIPLISPVNEDYTTSGDSFVVGSSSMEDLVSGSSGDSRMFFDVTNSAFRAGHANGNQWNSANRGQYSAAFGNNNTVSAHSGFSSGSQNRIFAGSDNSSSFGRDHMIYKQNCFVFGVGGLAKSIDGSIVHSNGFFQNAGDSQSETFILRTQINATSPYTNVDLGSIMLGANFGLDDFSTFLVKGEFILKQFNNGNTGVYTTTFVIKGIAATMPAILPSTPISLTTVYSDFAGVTINANVDPSGSGYNIVFSVSDSNARSNPVRWLAKVEILKLKFG
jgi:hypothetical protein